jgi:nucleoside-diphosphate-sugar epimerase
MPSQKVILLTGSTGFVGSAFLTSLHNISEYRVLSVVRSTRNLGSAQTESVVVGSIDGSTDYSAVVTGVDVVVHAAARAHIMRDEVASPLAEYRKVNVEGTLNLARQAAEEGVQRFIFISSIGAAFCKVVVASAVFLSCYFQCRLLPFRVECDGADWLPISRCT